MSDTNQTKTTPTYETVLNNLSKGSSSNKETIHISDVLWWLPDAPLFIDGNLIAEFHDAIVHPDVEIIKIRTGKLFQKAINIEEQIRTTANTKASVSGSATAKASMGIKPGGWIPQWLIDMLIDAELKAEASATGSIGGEHIRGRDNTDISRRSLTLSQDLQHEFIPIARPSRKLESIIFHYVQHHPEQIIIEHIDKKCAESFSWASGSNKGPAAREIVFLELSPGIPLIPTAAEFENGKVVPIFEDLVNRLTNEGGGPKRKYPRERDYDNQGQVDVKKFEEDKQAYWQSFREFYNARDAMLSIENATASNGRIKWIDLRIPLNTKNDMLHLHIKARGDYDGGDFAYNFVNRAYNYGIRLVGILRKGPSLNVLSIYEM